MVYACHLALVLLSRCVVVPPHATVMWSLRCVLTRRRLSPHSTSHLPMKLASHLRGPASLQLRSKTPFTASTVTAEGGAVHRPAMGAPAGGASAAAAGRGRAIALQPGSPSCTAGDRQQPRRRTRAAGSDGFLACQPCAAGQPAAVRCSVGGAMLRSSSTWLCPVLHPFPVVMRVWLPVYSHSEA